jgi:hypothetical protein
MKIRKNDDLLGLPSVEVVGSLGEKLGVMTRGARARDRDDDDNHGSAGARLSTLRRGRVEEERRRRER